MTNKHNKRNILYFNILCFKRFQRKNQYQNSNYSKYISAINKFLL